MWWNFAEKSLSLILRAACFSFASFFGCFDSSCFFGIIRPKREMTLHIAARSLSWNVQQRLWEVFGLCYYDQMFELHFEFFWSALFFRHMHFNVWLAAFFRFDSDTQIRCNEHTVTVHMHWIQYIIWITFGLIFNYIVFIYRDMKMMWTLSIYYHKTGEAKKNTHERKWSEEKTF